MWFLRVDLVALDNRNESWLVNELEFFGNADIHLECMGPLMEDLFDDLRAGTHGWLGSWFAEVNRTQPIGKLASMTKRPREEFVRRRRKKMEFFFNFVVF